MFEKIKELIVESLGIEEDQVEIPTEELEKMETVGDVVEYIKEHK